MKTNFAIALVLATMTIVSCSKDNESPKPESTRVVVVHDLTDRLTLPPIPEPILSLYGLSKNPNKEVEFNYVLLTNKLLNPVKRLHLGSKKETERNNDMDDPRHRQKLVAKFNSSVKDIFNMFPERFRNQESENGSRCFCTIIDQVDKLSKSRYEKKVMLVFSDLREHSRQLNLYDPQAREELQTNPDAVGRKLSEQCPIPKRLDNISIIFCYQPATKEEDEKFLEIVGVYETLLSERGAHITITATNENFPLTNELQ